jgi:hypothetical protein
LDKKFVLSNKFTLDCQGKGPRRTCARLKRFSPPVMLVRASCYATSGL